ncbi:hypothetical protein J4450_01435 [Candidatus Micrarchaeota archaeon]|nr:hypothetical protein [Candidatus Micrarchaeota archaeon]
MSGGRLPSATPTPAPEPAPQPTPSPVPQPAPQSEPVPLPIDRPSDYATGQAEIEPSPTPTPQPAPLPVPQPPPAPVAQPKVINGKTLSERLEEASDRLHTQGSGQRIRNDFPDIKLVYTDNAQGTGFPEMILPFKYYYSEEADKTFNICKIDLTVFICKGKLDKLITKDDIDSGRCEVTQVYQDPRAGGRGGYNYPYNS